jgi:anaerobic magnesium-protoporphyrin IX monomethyl ester cyclase
MARIALVNPQIATSSWRAPIMREWNDATIRHGLASLSACLKAKGHTVFLIDLRCLSGWEEYQEVLNRIKPDCVGVTAHTCEHDIALRSCELSKRVSHDIVTIAGGIQATMFPNAFLETGSVDYVLQGEGEVSFPKWVESPHSFPAVFRGELPDLDQVPFADRTLWEDYSSRIRYPAFGRFLPVPTIDIIAQRGCPWQCKFCCGPGEQNLYTKTVGGRVFPAVRSRSVNNVMEELSDLYDRYRFKSIVFHDDQFIIQPKWAEEFAAAMHERGFVARKVKFWCAIRADMVIRFESVVKSLRGAGLEMLSIGFESFSDRMLKWMNKGTTRVQNIEAARIARNLGLKIYSNVILGMPYADGKWYVEDDLESLAALDEFVKPEMSAMSFFTPVPGSPFYDWCEANALILSDAFGMTGQRGVGTARVRGVDYDVLNTLIASRRRVPAVTGDRVKGALVKLGLIGQARRVKYALQRVVGGGSV